MCIQEIKQRLFTSSGALRYHSWSLRAIRAHARPRAGVLVYHRIGETTFDPYGQAVSPDNFAQHLRHLRHDYHVTSLSELLEQLPSRDYHDRTVVITFDDGYADNLSAAYPITQQFDVSMTVFITVQPILQDALFWWDELAVYALQQPISASVSLLIGSGKRFTFSMASDTERRTTCKQLHSMLKCMTAGERQRAMEAVRSWAMPYDGRLNTGLPLTVAELQELATLPGVSIGAHTMTHPVLRALSIEEQTKELVSSKRKLEELIGRSLRLVAYPFGKSADFSRKSARLAARTGYQAAFTTMAKPVLPWSDLYALPRLTVHDWSEETFAQRLRVLFGEPPL